LSFIAFTSKKSPNLERIRANNLLIAKHYTQRTSGITKFTAPATTTTTTTKASKTTNKLKN
jgi:hypothetical protein